MTRIRMVAALAVVLVALAPAARQASGEPMFLSRQYPQCTSCHFSPTGGGLLTDYGRSLTQVDLSTSLGSDPDAAESLSGEQAFLYGALGDRLGGLRLGIDLSPSHLAYTFPGGDSSRNLLMTAEASAAYQAGGWTVYGQLDRKVRGSEVSLSSYEHWVGRQSESSGLGVRAGRFMPAYGVNFSDHTSFNRAPLGLDFSDQIYGVEVSRTGDRSLVQVAAGGRADPIVDNDGRRAFTTTARAQFDLTPRAVVVASGLFRAASDLAPRSGSAGVAFGFAPGSRLSVWTEADALADAGPRGTAWVVVNETAFEAWRGVWLKVSPQLRTDGGDGTGDLGRLMLGAVVLPRTHWNVNVSYYRDRNRDFGISTTAFLTQLHLFL